MQVIPSLPSGLKRAGHRLHSDVFFDTLKINCSVAAKDILERAEQRKINLRVYTEGVVRIRMFGADGKLKLSQSELERLVYEWIWDSRHCRRIHVHIFFLCVY